MEDKLKIDFSDLLKTIDEITEKQLQRNKNKFVGYILYKDWLMYSRNELRPELGDKIYNGSLEESFIDESDTQKWNDNPYLFFKLLESVNFIFYKIDCSIIESNKISTGNNELDKIFSNGINPNDIDKIK